MALKNRVKMSHFLPSSLKGKIVIVNSQGDEMKSSGPTFKSGTFPVINVAELNEKSVKHYMNVKHPNIMDAKEFDKLQKSKK